MPLAMIAALGEGPMDVAGALQRLCTRTPVLRVQLEPQLAVTATPTMIRTSQTAKVIPAYAEVSLDVRVPPGVGGSTMLARIRELLGEIAAGVDLRFAEQNPGRISPPASRLRSAIDVWIAKAAPGARTVPTLLPAGSDSSYSRSASPDVAAYGFFPTRHQTAGDIATLVHGRDERIDRRDLAFGTRF